MKILIGFLLALFISGQAYAQSATEIINKGKILNLGAQSENSAFKAWHVIYKQTYYVCFADNNKVSCQAPKDYGSDGLKVN